MLTMKNLKNGQGLATNKNGLVYVDTNYKDEPTLDSAI